jgi:hypothetical protein
LEERIFRLRKSLPSFFPDYYSIIHIFIAMSLPTVAALQLEAKAENSQRKGQSADNTRSNSIDDQLEKHLSASRKPGTGSDPTVRHSNSLTDMVKEGIEKRQQRVYQSSPRFYIYNSSNDQLRSIHSEIIHASMKEMNTKKAATSSEALGSRNEMKHKESSRSQLLRIGEDRVVSTSYTESLEQIFNSSRPQQGQAESNLLTLWNTM